jgi:hypothetical protein
MFHRVVAMIQLAHLMFQDLNHQALLGKLIISSICVRFFPIYKFQCGLLFKLSAALIKPMDNY